MTWTGAKPPKCIRKGDRWRKDDEGTLWAMDVKAYHWVPINAITFEEIKGDPIPFPKSTRIM